MPASLFKLTVHKSVSEAVLAEQYRREIPDTLIIDHRHISERLVYIEMKADLVVGLNAGQIKTGASQPPGGDMVFLTGRYNSRKVFSPAGIANRGII